MNRKIFFRGAFGTSILLALTVIGFRPEPLAEAARNGSGDIPKAAKQHLVETYGKLPLSFEANLGQTSSQVKFLSRGQGYTLFLTRHAEAVLALGKTAPKRTLVQPVANLSAVVEPQPEPAPPAVLRMKLVGAKRTPQVEGLGKFPGNANYFIGNDPKKWRTNVPTYAKVRYREVYPGVDLVYYGNQRQLEHDFIIAPGTDPGSITMAVEGAERLSLDAQGDLVLAMKEGEVRFQKPMVYQEIDGVRREIPSSYMFKDAHQVGFQVAAYDVSRALVIDPVLAYSTYLGGSSDDMGRAIAVDSGGNAYVTGITFSTNFPGASSSLIQSSHGGGTDAFVAKINALGTALVYSTYLGGSSDEEGYGIAVDSVGNAYVTGFTSSTNFPGASSSMIQPSNGGGTDAFVATINALGTALLYSTYLGGSGNDQGLGIAVDSVSNAYVIGFTNSTNFPGASSSLIQPSGYGGAYDAFVLKISNITCKPKNDDVEGDGHERGDDGREGKFHFCKSSGEMDFEERASDGKILGQPMRGKMNTVTLSRNQAVITGSGTLADGTPLNYTAVVLGNQPVIGANHFAISWIAANGSVFQTSGGLTDGYIVVNSQ